MSILPFHLQNTMLPENYIVGLHDVIIGRGKKCSLNPGNQRFREIVQATLDCYSNAETKAVKSEVITNVLAQVRGGSGAGFVKLHSGTGRYLQVEEASSRIAIAQAFRDALSWTYKSSKKSKQIRRLERMRTSENEGSLTESAMQVQQPFEVHGTTLRNQAENANTAPWPTMQMRGLPQEPSFATPVGEPQPFTLPTTTFMAPTPLSLADTEPLPLCNLSVGQPSRPITSNLASSNMNNSELLTSLLTSLGTVVCNAASPFEPTQASGNQQADLTSYSHYCAPRAKTQDWIGCYFWTDGS